jgi:undecaprenyl diphosphate synthase
MTKTPDFKVLPRHIAIIMDGNGRWARRRRRPRIFGHRAGIESIRDVVRAGAEIGLEALTLYAFSVENWDRPRGEVRMLMSLLADYLRGEKSELMENHIVLKTIGRTDDLPAKPRELLRENIKATSGNGGMILNLALSYSGRDEVARAVSKLLAESKKRKRSKSVSEADIAAALDQPDLPDPDLLIRTGGEMRVSNFLLWQIAYTELYVTEEYWPEFRREHLFRAIAEYGKRERRFGRVK